MKRFYIVPLCLNLLACAPIDGDSTIEEQGRGTPAPEVCSEPAPTVGEHGIGILHNAAMAMIKRNVDNGEFSFSEDNEANVAGLSRLLSDWLCEMKFDCDDVNAIAADVTSELNTVARGTRDGASLPDSLNTHLGRMSGLPPWLLPTLPTFPENPGRDARSMGEITRVFAAIGKDEGCYDGGDYGRIGRGIASASIMYWAAMIEADPESVGRDLGGVAGADVAGGWLGLKAGAAFGPWGGVAGAVIGGGCISAIAAWGP